VRCGLSLGARCVEAQGLQRALRNNGVGGGVLDEAAQVEVEAGHFSLSLGAMR
jgi:hypothetical protein